jgi:hypothetical protein
LSWTAPELAAGTSATALLPAAKTRWTGTTTNKDETSDTIVKPNTGLHRAGAMTARRDRLKELGSDIELTSRVTPASSFAEPSAAALTSS